MSAISSALLHDKIAFSLTGHEVVTDTNAHEGNFCGLQVISATAAVSAIDYADDYDNDGDLTDLTSIPVTAGPIFCRFTSITLSAGQVILFKL